MAAPAAKASTPPSSVSASSESPIQHSNWLWRRWYCFGLTVVLLALLRIAIEKEAAEYVIKAICWSLVFVAVMFLTTPSFEQIGKMFATAWALVRGASLTTTNTAETSEGSATSSTTATGATPPPQQPSDDGPGSVARE